MDATTFCLLEVSLKDIAAGSSQQVRHGGKFYCSRERGDAKTVLELATWWVLW